MDDVGLGKRGGCWAGADVWGGDGGVLGPTVLLNGGTLTDGFGGVEASVTGAIALSPVIVPIFVPIGVAPIGGGRVGFAALG